MRVARAVSFSPGSRDMEVADGPGLTALMRTPSAMWSRAAARVRAETAALVAMYPAIPGTRRWAPRLEARLTMAPPVVCSRIRAISVWRLNSTPVRLMSTRPRQSSSGRSATGPPPRKTPALLTATSRLPKRATVWSTSARTSSERDTSAVNAAAVPPSFPIRATVSSSGAAVRPAATTEAPSAAKASATARPMPEPAPVTRTVLPVKRVVMMMTPPSF